MFLGESWRISLILDKLLMGWCWNQGPEAALKPTQG